MLLFLILLECTTDSQVSSLSRVHFPTLNLYPTEGCLRDIHVDARTAVIGHHVYHWNAPIVDECSDDPLETLGALDHLDQQTLLQGLMLLEYVLLELLETSPDLGDHVFTL